MMFAGVNNIISVLSSIFKILFVTMHHILMSKTFYTMIKKILKYLLIVIVLVVVALGGFLIYSTVTDFEPEESVVLSKTDKYNTLSDTATYSAMIWNIGYCGLDEDMDFFYDGGTKVFTPESSYNNNILYVNNFIKGNDSINFIMLQEVDRDSKRSYHDNQYKRIEETLGGHKHASFAYNYIVDFVPMPVTSPLGRVRSGLATYSHYTPETSVRWAFPGNYSWPTSIFMLDRCFMVNRYNLDNGKQLVVINTHNSAYDDGSLKKAQMDYLKKFLITEYNNGNYIVVGGDWNQSAPGNEEAYKAKHGVMNKIAEDYLPDWNWRYSAGVPTNRSLKSSYNSNTRTTIIDFFLLSPNIITESVNTINLHFKHSDHNPVIIKFNLM
jgi:endonuclease/exonuclease/phosphatase family metal-dependent hydrolase